MVGLAAKASDTLQPSHEVGLPIVFRLNEFRFLDSRGLDGLKFLINCLFDLFQGVPCLGRHFDLEVAADFAGGLVGADILSDLFFIDESFVEPRGLPPAQDVCQKV